MHRSKDTLGIDETALKLGFVAGMYAGVQRSTVRANAAVRLTTHTRGGASEGESKSNVFGRSGTR